MAFPLSPMSPLPPLSSLLSAPPSMPSTLVQPGDLTHLNNVPIWWQMTTSPPPLSTSVCMPSSPVEPPHLIHLDNVSILSPMTSESSQCVWWHFASNTYMTTHPLHLPKVPNGVSSLNSKKKQHICHHPNCDKVYRRHLALLWEVFHTLRWAPTPPLLSHGRETLHLSWVQQAFHAEWPSNQAHQDAPGTASCWSCLKLSRDMDSDTALAAGSGFCALTWGSHSIYWYCCCYILVLLPTISYS